MKNIFKYILLSGVAAAALSSCDLDLSPTTTIKYEEGQEYITSEGSLGAFQNGIVSSFRARQRGVYVVTGDLMMDAFNATTDYANHYGDVHRQETKDDTYDTRDMWSGHYSSIKNYNFFIDAVNGMSDENKSLKAKAEIAKGYAHLFRANSYLTLARHFAKAYNPATAATDECVPIILHFNILEKPSRATVAEVYKQIKADLDEAAKLLAGQVGKIRSTLPTIDAVYAEYTRYFIDVKDYENAAKYANLVINSKAGYTLAKNDKLTKEEELMGKEDEYTAEFISDQGNEPIMQTFISQSELTGQMSEDYTALYDYRSYGFGYAYRPLFIPSGKLLEAYDKGDLRLKHWFTTDKRYTVINGYVYKGDFYVFTRFEGNPKLSTSGIPNGYNAAKPYTIAEMYLVGAEANAMLNHPDEAKSLLNTLQEARGAKLTEGTMENIKAEWFKETVGLGMRLPCLKRWGDGFGGPRKGQAGAIKEMVIVEGPRFTELNMPANDFHLTWPIPAYELQVNDNLKGHQNPGYGEQK